MPKLAVWVGLGLAAWAVVGVVIWAGVELATTIKLTAEAVGG